MSAPPFIIEKSLSAPVCGFNGWNMADGWASPAPSLVADVQPKNLGVSERESAYIYRIGRLVRIGKCLLFFSLWVFHSLQRTRALHG